MEAKSAETRVKRGEIGKRRKSACENFAGKPSESAVFSREKQENLQIGGGQWLDKRQVYLYYRGELC